MEWSNLILGWVKLETNIFLAASASNFCCLNLDASASALLALRCASSL